MKNITITLQDDVAKWARVWAARHDRSLSRMVGDLLQKQKTEEEQYETAMHAFLNQKPKRLRKKNTQYPKRDELYERDVLR